MQDTIIAQFPCFGLSFIGKCSYDPSHPYASYFGLGNAVSALGFTLAIQQFLKPIYLFRLSTYGLKLSYLFLLIFLGVFCSAIAALLPNLPIPHDSFFEYPITWELFGAFLVIGTYGITAFISLRPAHIYNFNLISFVRAAANLLSKADDVDRVAFAEDLSRNLPKLIKYTSAWKAAIGSAYTLEFARLKEMGAPQEIRGQPEISPFYRFTHRAELERASYSGNFLKIISDPHFCSALVRKCPWRTASMMQSLSEKEIHVDHAEVFVQEVARQAIINDESIVTREINYDGFGAAPLLSESLFGNWFILSNYNPLQKLWLGGSDESSAGYISRLNGASEMILETALEHKDYWSATRYMNSVEHAFENLFLQYSLHKYKELSVSIRVEMHSGISRFYDLLSENIDTLDTNKRKQLFVTDPQKYSNDLVHIIASIIFKSLESVANSFTGHDDPMWHHAIGTFMDIYPFHASEPAGMTPLQQQLALMLIDKLRENMKGWYPAISRVILAVLQPYENKLQTSTRTAYVILKDAAYKELQKLPELWKEKPEKFLDFFPNNVTYDPTSNILTHIFAGGDTHSTNLSTLNIPEINLLDEANWRI